MATKPTTKPDEKKTPSTKQPNAGTSAQANTADATNPSAQPPADNSAGKDLTIDADEKAEIDALEVVSFDPVFYRAGFEFTRTPRVLMLSDLSDSQIKQLKNEPLISVREVTTPIPVSASK